MSYFTVKLFLIVRDPEASRFHITPVLVSDCSTIGSKIVVMLQSAADIFTF